MDPTQMRYAVLKWVSDNNKLSIEHLKVIQDPEKPYNDYSVGEHCTARFGPLKKLYPVVIVAVGGKWTYS
jgi:hypothetical protein